jgi:hypothetical protein
MRALTITSAVSLATSASQAATNLLGASDVLPPISVSNAIYNVTATSATPAVFTITAGQTTQGLQNYLPVVLSGTTAPTGFTLGTTYYTIAVSGATFELSATVGGAAIASSSTGTAVVAIFVAINDGAGPATAYSQGAQFNVSCPTASPGVFTGAYLPNGTAIVLSAQINPATNQAQTTAAAPGGFTYGTTYYVVSANQPNGTFQLSATSGGSAINASSAAVFTQATALNATSQYAVAGPGSPFLPGYSAVLALTSNATQAGTSFIVEGAQDTMNPPGTPGTYSTIASIVGVSTGMTFTTIGVLPQYIRTRVVTAASETGTGTAVLMAN